ncbi:MAG: Fe-S cluster assembly protein SufD [Pseudomonadota bacterium]
MNAPLKLTAGEQALIDTFGQTLQDLPGNADTIHARDAAIQTLKKHGLPTRKVEAWHYTDLRRLLAAPKNAPQEAMEAIAPIIPGSRVFSIENGEAQNTDAVEGLNAEMISAALRAEVGAFVPAFDGAEDAIGLINSAFVSDGYRLTVADSAKIERPIEIQSRTSTAQAHAAHTITIGKDAEAVFVDRSFTGANAFTSAVTHITVKSGSTVDWIVVQEHGAAASHLAKLVFDIAEGATVNLFVANFGGKLVRQEVHAACNGENAHLNFRAVNLIGDETHCDVTLVLDHKVPNTTSEETVRNVITGKGQGVFQGQIRVAQIAQKTDAQMAANTLLLSDEAGVSVKPELEIFADDVICAHGATVAEIDETHLFYLMARGISQKAARGLLVKAFVAELVEELENEALVEALEDRIDTWLEAHG